MRLPAGMTAADVEWLEADIRRRLGEGLAERVKQQADEWGERLLKGDSHERDREQMRREAYKSARCRDSRHHKCEEDVCRCRCHRSARRVWPA